MKKLGLFLLLSLTLGAQNPPVKDSSFAVYKTTSLSSAAEVITIQHRSTDNRNIIFKSVYMYCSAACTINIEGDGAAATSTSLTSSIYNINPKVPSAKVSSAQAYSSSNVGSGNVLNQIQLSAGGSISIDLSDFLLPSGIATNLSFRTNSITATVTIGVSWYEQ